MSWYIPVIVWLALSMSFAALTLSIIAVAGSPKRKRRDTRHRLNTGMIQRPVLPNERPGSYSVRRGER